MDASEQRRAQFLFDLMRDIGMTSMSTSELEEWSALMAKSLEGKGDHSVPVEEAHTTCAIEL